MTVAIIGSGNMANYLVSRLAKKVSVVALCSRNLTTANAISKKYKIVLKTLPEIIAINPDVIILAVNDDSIDEIAKQIKKSPSLIIHCSGSTPIETIKKYCTHTAVLWPLISISAIAKPKNNFPVCIEASDEKSLATVHSISKFITKNVYVYNSAQRLQLHLMAVVVNNFTNHFYNMASDIANEKELDFNILKPIIAQTANNIMHHSPGEVQTGPAKRHDEKTMQRHLQLLKSKNRKALYKMISDDIYVTNKNTKFK